MECAALLAIARRGAESRAADIALGFVAAALCLVLYLRTISPGVLGGDAGEFQFVPYILGLMHPTGYPLATLLGKAWISIIPFGSVAYRMNLFSAVSAAASVGLLYGSIRLISGSRLGAFFGSLLLGVSGVFWTEATGAEKYAFSALLLTLVLFTLARWTKRRDWNSLALCALCFGISLTHHRSMLVFLPWLVGYWLWLAPSSMRRPRYALLTALLVGAPLLLYLWIPYAATKGLPPRSSQSTSLPALVAYFLDSQYMEAVRPGESYWGQLAIYLKTLWEQFTPYGIALALAGVVHQIRSRKPILAFLALGFLSQAALTAGYGVNAQVTRYWVFFIPSYILFAIWMGEGITWVLSVGRAQIRHDRALGLGTTAVVLASVFALVGLLARSNYAALREAHLDGGALDLYRQDLKSGYLAQRFAENSLPLIEPNSTVIADWEQTSVLWYYQQVEKWNPGVTLSEKTQWQNAIATGRPTYLARTIPYMGQPYHFTAVGSIIRVLTQPSLQVPADVSPLSFRFDNQIDLVGYRFYQQDFRAGYVLPFSLYFRAARPLERSYSVKVRLFPENGDHEWWSEDREKFALGMYSTVGWVEGEVVGDYFEVPFPRSTPCGRYRIGVTIYTTTEANTCCRNLSLMGSGSDVAFLPPVDVPPRQ